MFPEGTRGPALDTMTRAPLWARGLQFNHGTGHGIGCWLNVHEPPVGLYLSPRADCVAQEMIKNVFQNKEGFINLKKHMKTKS